MVWGEPHGDSSRRHTEEFLPGRDLCVFEVVEHAEVRGRRLHGASLAKGHALPKEAHLGHHEERPQLLRDHVDGVPDFEFLGMVLDGAFTLCATPICEDAVFGRLRSLSQASAKRAPNPGLSQSRKCI